MSIALGAALALLVVVGGIGVTLCQRGKARRDRVDIAAIERERERAREPECVINLRGQR